MAKTSIEWTDDTWNPVSGCTRVSAGCDNCYAVKMTRRLEAMGQEKYSGLVNIGKGHFNGVVKCHEDALTIPLRAKKPRRWFVNSMSDRHVTPRVLESEFRCEHAALGRSVEFFRRDDNPGPCDCLEESCGQ